MASDITGFPREKIDSVDEYLDSYAKFLRHTLYAAGLFSSSEMALEPMTAQHLENR